jgi:hypothetical protein
MPKPRPLLSTEDIDHRMRRVKYFIGTMPLNALQTVTPPYLYLPLKMVVNLEPDTRSGNHWVAIARNKSGAIMYYDSTGKPPPPEIQHWITRNSITWNYSEKVMQKKNDLSSCGYLCISFLNNFDA